MHETSPEKTEAVSENASPEPETGNPPTEASTAPLTTPADEPAVADFDDNDDDDDAGRGSRWLPAHAMLSLAEANDVSGIGRERMIRAVKSGALRGALVGGRVGVRIVYGDLALWVGDGAPDKPRATVITVTHPAPSPSPSPAAAETFRREVPPPTDAIVDLESLGLAVTGELPPPIVPVPEPGRLFGMAIGESTAAIPSPPTQAVAVVVGASRKEGVDREKRLLDEIHALHVEVKDKGIPKQAPDEPARQLADSESDMLAELERGLGGG